MKKLISKIKLYFAEQKLAKQETLEKEEIVKDIIKILLQSKYDSFCFWYFLKTPLPLTRIFYGLNFDYSTIRNISYNTTFSPRFSINRFVDRAGIPMHRMHFEELLMSASKPDLENLKLELSTANLEKRPYRITPFIE